MKNENLKRKKQKIYIITSLYYNGLVFARVGNIGPDLLDQ